MSGRAPLQLSVLRKIGWEHWDPIGLAPPDEACADEYDSYLTSVASLMRNGTSEDEAARYLISIAVDHMGLGTAELDDHRDKAMRTAKAIKDYLVTLDR